MVSEWMENGSITEFVKEDVAVNWLKLVCLSFNVPVFACR
jgi:hypothetical protein